MAEKSIRDRVITVITDVLNVEPEKVTDDARFVEDLGADSLDTVELVMALEEEFDIDVEDETADGWNTVGDVHQALGGESA